MRILLVQRSLSPPGGGNAVAAWMIHALAGEHDLDVLTLGDWLPAQTNAFYGTAVPPAITRRGSPWPWSQLALLPADHGRHLSMCALLRQARRLSANYDLLITADNFGAFTTPGIQYMHYPIALEPSGSHPVAAFYLRLCDRIAGVPWRQARRNLTLANSQWTAAGLARDQGLRATVLYPPVIDPGEGRPWEERRNNFLCIGRFHGSKRIEVAISIVRRMRAHVLPDARLTILGSAVDKEYLRRIRMATTRDRHWIEFSEDPSREETNRLIGECRYGLHAMVDEHFGMATAEMARGGCLVFAHDSGGSREVLAGENALLWRHEDEAVTRISALVRDASMRDAVRWRLRQHAGAFSSQRFVREIRAIVAQVSSRNAGSASSS